MGKKTSPFRRKTGEKAFSNFEPPMRVVNVESYGWKFYHRRATQFRIFDTGRIKIPNGQPFEKTLSPRDLGVIFGVSIDSR